MKKRDVSTIVFYTTKKEVLMQDRKGISKYGEEWSFFGGGIEEGETPREAIIRETKEELNYNLNELEEIGNCHFKNEKIECTRHVFIAPLKNELQKMSVLEGKQGKLFSITEAKKLKLIPGEEQVIELVEKTLT